MCVLCNPSERSPANSDRSNICSAHLHQLMSGVEVQYQNITRLPVALHRPELFQATSGYENPEEYYHVQES